MHLGLLLLHADGLYQILYVVVLTEFCDNTSLAISPYLRGGRKLVSHIDHKRTLASTAVSVALTILLAWVMKSLLPHDAGQYWLAAGLVASVAGLLGDLVMTAVRKDTGVNHVGLFILGRGDLLRRMDRLIFVAPIYYHLMSALDKL